MTSSLHSMCSLYEKVTKINQNNAAGSVIIDFKLYLAMVYFHNKNFIPQYFFGVIGQNLWIHPYIFYAPASIDRGHIVFGLFGFPQKLLYWPHILIGKS